MRLTVLAVIVLLIVGCGGSEEVTEAPRPQTCPEACVIDGIDVSLCVERVDHYRDPARCFNCPGATPRGVGVLCLLSAPPAEGYCHVYGGGTDPIDLLDGNEFYCPL